ncbi:MAG: metallophosphoesterase family protein, partial [Clostridiales bacterium]|nr:metallophosphoesterase family protein [Clostridiales bacterium]
MRVGVITDVHNNAAALDVALGALRRAGCGRILCCGDIIGIGPRPEETVRRLARLPGLVAVRGNHERYLLEGMPDAVPNDQGMGRDEMEHHRWEHSRLSAQSISFLRALPCRADIELGGLRVAVMHYAMSGGRYLDLAPQPGPDDCRRMFAEVDADVVLYGHDH